MNPRQIERIIDQARERSRLLTTHQYDFQRWDVRLSRRAPSLDELDGDNQADEGASFDPRTED